MRDGAPGSYGRRCRSSQHGWWMVWAATKYSLVLVAGEKMEKCALTDDGKTIGSYNQHVLQRIRFFRVVVDPYLHVRYHHQ